MYFKYIIKIVNSMDLMSSDAGVMQIIIDDRERAVVPFFKNHKKIPPNISFSVERINIGDYSIVYKNNILMIIERKTWNDLASSIVDGRKHNVNKMLKLRDETGCKIFYLIEGNPAPNPKSKYCRIPYKNLRSHLDHLMFRDDIHIIHSKNQENTVDRIIALVQNYLSIKPSPLLKYDEFKIEQIIGGSNPTDVELTLDPLSVASIPVIDTSNTSAIKKLNEKTPVSDEYIIYKIWSCVPYITEKTSGLFIDKDYHISDLILGKIPKESIYTLKYDNGHIIGKKSEKIWNGSRIKACNNKYFSKMLSQINGITKKTADIILKTISFESLLNGEIQLKNISSIKKTERATIGIKASMQILKYFVKKCDIIYH
jgi:ERCC4-type nuclease